MMAAATEIGRREFLKFGAIGGAALIVGFHLPARSRAPQSQSQQVNSFTPNAWVRITPDNQVTVLVEKPEMGQGQRTTEAMLLAEELEIDFSTIRIEQAPPFRTSTKAWRPGAAAAPEKVGRACAKQVLRRGKCL
jgi:isoquinoline 1-oxidoreductase beta subunit